MFKLWQNIPEIFPEINNFGFNGELIYEIHFNNR